MERLNVNPTRMELAKQRTRLRVSIRGHKLLKDKADEMMRQFVLLVKQNVLLREGVEPDMQSALKSFITAYTRMTSQAIESALSTPIGSVEFSAALTNIMGLIVPKLNITNATGTLDLPYSITTTSIHLDEAIKKLQSLMPRIVMMAEVEKSCDMLSLEIERNRKRTNALEFIVIPQIRETIRYISMKLDEQERNNIVRLMKVKEILQARN